MAKPAKENIDVFIKQFACLKDALVLPIFDKNKYHLICLSKNTVLSFHWFHSSLIDGDNVGDSVNLDVDEHQHEAHDYI